MRRTAHHISLSLENIRVVAELQMEMCKLGYACGYEGKIYKPVHVWAGKLPKSKDLSEFTRDAKRFHELDACELAPSSE